MEKENNSLSILVASSQIDAVKDICKNLSVSINVEETDNKHFERVTIVASNWLLLKIGNVFGLEKIIFEFAYPIFQE